jgi:hypothetical protein
MSSIAPRRSSSSLGVAAPDVQARLTACRARTRLRLMKRLSTSVVAGLLALTAMVAPAVASSFDAQPQCGDEKKGDTKDDKKDDTKPKAPSLD